MGWPLGLLAVTATVVSLARLVTGRRAGRAAAGGELLMAVGMAAMALPMTASAFMEHSLWWAAVFLVAALTGIGMAVRDARRRSWRHGRHWTHQVMGSTVMVLMALAATPDPAGPAVALGMPTMAGMEGMHGMSSTDSKGMDGMAGMEGMEHTEGMAGMEGHAGMDGTSADSDSDSAAGAAPIWRLAFAALALYFLLSMGASLWAQVRRSGRSVPARATGQRDRWRFQMLKTLDVVVIYLISLVGSLRDLRPVRDRVEWSSAGSHRRNPSLGTSPTAALVAHVAMGSSMSVMLLMMT